MKITRMLLQLLALTGLLSLVACSSTQSSVSTSGAPTSALYACNCGSDCKCTTVSTKAGKCSCGEQLKGFHVLKVDGNDALLCQCGADCKCAVNETDPTKCGCGKPVKKVSLKGTGLYFCNCGSSCTCNTFSEQPAKCKCGMALKRVD